MNCWQHYKCVQLIHQLLFETRNMNPKPELPNQPLILLAILRTVDSKQGYLNRIDTFCTPTVQKAVIAFSNALHVFARSRFIIYRVSARS